MFFVISGALIALRIFFISNTLLIDDEAYYAMYDLSSPTWFDYSPYLGKIASLYD